MSEAKLVLDDDQKFTLMKFKRSVNNILEPHHDDAFLLRWLRARSWNLEAAEKMLRQSMKWRQQWEVDTALKDWEPPAPIQLFYPSGTCGIDKDGSPIIVVPFAGFDVVGLLHSTSKQEIVRMTIKTIEKNLKIAAKSGTHKVVVIFDMEDFSLRPYAWRPAGELIVALIQMYEANYPEILKACYIINAPSVFALAFSVVKRFMNEYTLGKIQIFKKDPKKWQPVILQNIEKDQLPKYLGGNLMDPDGNPKYTTKIRQGGKIPKSYYTKNLQFDENSLDKREYVTDTIKKGDKLVLYFDVAEEGCFLRWDFKTEDHDIRFGITLQDPNGNSSIVERHRRVASHQIDESGVLACQAPAKYIVTFDNTYSLLRSKKIHYCINITSPLKKMDHLLKTNEEDITHESEHAVTKIIENEENRRSVIKAS